MKYKHLFPLSTTAPCIRKRRGISLLEVIFATGVLLIGLLGLASVLPIATNNALESLNNDRSKEAYLNQSNLREVLGLNDLSTANAFFVGENSEARFVATRNAYQQWQDDHAQYLIDLEQFNIAYARWEIEFQQWQVAKNDFDQGNGADPGPPPSAPSPRPVPPAEKPRPAQFPVRSASSLPDVFCIDPWFLTASNTLRPAQANYYDRTVFPCYDDHYPVVDVSPSAEMPALPARLDLSPHRHWSIGFGQNYRRMPRIGLSDLVSAEFNQTVTKDNDSIAQILNPDDKQDFTGLMIKRAKSGRFATSTLTGRYSYMITARRNGTGNVIVFKDRQVAIDSISDDYRARHNLEKYTALEASVTNIPIQNRTYADERLGYVSYADKIFRGNGGSFTYKISKYCDPSIQVGDWVMLMRRDFTTQTYPFTVFLDDWKGANATIPAPMPGDLKFQWCQIASVDEGPTLIDESYVTTVTVRDVNWIFHPIQDYHLNLGSGPYFESSQAQGQKPPVGWNNRVYDLDKVTGEFVNFGSTGQQGDVLYGTSVVLMRNVVHVQDF